MAMYEAYWPMGFPIINFGGTLTMFCFEASCAKYKPIIMLFMFSKNINEQV